MSIAMPNYVMRVWYRLRRRFVRWYRRHKKFSWVIAGAFGVFIVYAAAFAAPLNFPENTLVIVEEGQSVRDVAATLQEKGLIHSSTAFEAVVRLTGGVSIAGQYSFQQRENVLAIAKRVASGDFRIKATRVKIMEGWTAREIAKQLGEQLEDFDEAKFLKLAEPKEGYLFPDTYFIYPGATPETVLAMLTTAFEEEINKPSVRAAIEKSGKSLSELVIMASLLEREAPQTEDRRLIAGILWTRIQKGMLLQVDAVFPYILGKNSFELTKADLAMDHPYNTYVHKGLPAGPIANPSLNAILAAANPIKTNYLFYLSDMQGNMHYSATYAEHLAYKRKYLDS